MSDLVVIVYPTLEKAEEVRTRLFELQREYIIKLADAVIATKSVRSSCTRSSTQRRPARCGALSGVC
jgi:uncharacterized membrane protein